MLRDHQTNKGKTYFRIILFSFFIWSIANDEYALTDTMNGFQSYFSSIYSFINTLLFFHFHLHFVKEFLNVLLSFIVIFLHYLLGLTYFYFSLIFYLQLLI